MEPYQPSPEQLSRINQYTPANLPELTAEEIVWTSIVVADNLLNRGLGKWSSEDMPRIVDLLPGLPFTLDHDWDEVSKTQGIIFDSELKTADEAPADVLGAAGNLYWNNQIVEKEGFTQAIAHVAFPASSAAVTGLKFGLLNTVSMGGFRFTDILCPLCSTSFEDKHCPHYVPDPWYSTDDENFAPFYVRYGVNDLGEVSFVEIPNLPGAGVIKRYQVFRDSRSQLEEVYTRSIS